MSIEISKTFQQYDLVKLNKIISHRLFYALFFYIPLHFFFKKTTPKTFLNVFQFYASVYLYSLFKLLIRGSRPSLEDEGLIEGKYFCEPDYGSPSGHMMVGTTILLIISMDIGESCKKIHKLILNLLLSVLLVIFGLSRVYYGVHSIDQLFLGICFALFIYFFFKAYEDELVNAFISPLLFKNNNKNSLFTYVKAILIANTLLLSVWFYAYQRENSKGYYDFINNCQMALNHVPKFSTKLLRDGLMVNFIFGLVIGLYLNTTNLYLALNFYYDKSIAKCLLRIFINLSFFGLSLMTRYPKIDNVLLIIMRNLLIVPVCGFLSGKYLFRLFDLLGVSYQKEEKKELSKKEHKRV